MVRLASILLLLLWPVSAWGLGYRSDSYPYHSPTHCAWQWGTNQPWIEYPVRADADGPYCYIDNAQMPEGVAIVKAKAVKRSGIDMEVLEEESPPSAPIYVLKIRSSTGSVWIGEYTWICRDGTCRKL